MRKDFCAPVVATLLAALLLAAGCGEPGGPGTPVPSEPAAPAPAEPSAPVPAETPARPEGCPPDAVAFAGHWYKAFEDDVTWHEARRRCEAAGGHLACIETPEEQAFLAGLADGRYLYLGGTDEAEEGTWVWINGSPWAEAFWMAGQPNDYGGEEHYLATYDGGEWVDVAAEGEGFWMPTGYVCEWGD